MRSSVRIGTSKSIISGRRITSSSRGWIFGETGINYIFLEQFGVIGSDGDINREIIQDAIDFSSLTGRPILLTEPYYLYNVDSSGRGLDFKSNMSIISHTEAVFDVRANGLKSQAFGGLPPESQIRAITIDNSIAPVNNLRVENLTVKTVLDRWYDNNGFIVSIPIGLYLNNTNIDSDFVNATPASNYTFLNFDFQNFQRTSITVRGRRIENVSWTNSSFTDIARAELQYPTESRYIYTDVVVDGLPTNTTSYNFGVSDMIGVSVALYNGGSTPLYSIPYPKTTTNTAIGEIIGNPLTSGNLQWTLGAGIQSQITSISVIGHRRGTDATGAESINGIGLDFSNAEDLTISGCDFTGCADPFSHYIYMTREVNDVSVLNNTFRGLGIKVINSGGGMHIRGAAYNNVNVVGNEFHNTHQNINVSSVSNATITGNTHTWNYDLPPNGNMGELNYGAVSTMLYSGNTSISTNTFQPYIWVVGYLTPSAMTNITLSNNTASGINSINCLGTNVSVTGNTLSSSAYDTNNTAVIVMAHNNVNDTLNISFTNNTIAFNGLNPQPKIEGFSGFTWAGNTINTINTFRMGDALKLRNVTVSGAVSNLRLNCSGTINITNFTGIVSYSSSAVYLDMVQNQDVTMTNCTDTGSLPRSVSSNEFVVVGTGNINVNAPSAQNLAYIDLRVFTNTSTYQQQYTNVSAFSLTLKNYASAFHTRNNLVTPSGVDFVVPSLGTFTLQLDDVNARLVKI